MTKVPSYKNGNNIWNDVYKVDLDPNQYDKIIFYSTDKLTGDTSAKTEDNATFTGFRFSLRSIFTIRDTIPICCCPEISITSIEATI